MNKKKKIQIYLGSNIRHLRKARNLRAYELGSLIKVSRSAIGSYENNLHEPSILCLSRLSEVFNIPIHNLILTDLSKPIEICQTN